MYRFSVSASGDERPCFGNSLSINKSGDLRIRLDGRTVGYFKSGYWQRVYLPSLDNTTTDDEAAVP